VSDPRLLVDPEVVKTALGGDFTEEDSGWADVLPDIVEDVSDAMIDYVDRELVGPGETETRRWDVDRELVLERELEIGDLGDSAGMVVKIYDRLTGTLLQTVPNALIVALPRNRKPWEPYSTLWFLAGDANSAQLATSSVVEVTSDKWGFPAVPPRVRRLAIFQVRAWAARDPAIFSRVYDPLQDRILKPDDLEPTVKRGLERLRVPSVA
jgi:hypothetical protein